MTSVCNKKNIVKHLKDIEAYKNFEEPITLKSGRKSHFYVDMRETIRFPVLLATIAEEMSKIIVEKFVHVDVVCGLPYGAIPLATLVAQRLHVGLLILRKEQKSHGTKRMIEGLPKKVSSPLRCVFIDDVITSGTSIVESLEIFKDYAHKVSVIGVAVVVDREEPKLEKLTVDYYSLLKLSEFNKIHVFDEERDIVDGVEGVEGVEGGSNDPSDFLRRSKLTKNPITQKMFLIACKKKSNVIVSIDNPDPKTAIEIAVKVAPHVCGIKFHYDIFSDFQLVLKKLRGILGDKLDDLIIFEDRKFSDIGNTVKSQYTMIKEMYRKNGVPMNLTNAFVVCGPKTVEALYQAESISKGSMSGLLLISSLSTSDNCLSEENVNVCDKLLYEPRYEKFLTGLICQKRTGLSDGMVYCTPGVNLNQKTDKLNQRYRNVKDAIIRDRCDFIIVGRGICGFTPSAGMEGEYQYCEEKAKEYKTEGWRFLVERQKGN